MKIELHIDALPYFTALDIKPARFGSFVLGELSCEWEDALLENSNWETNVGVAQLYLISCPL